MRSALRERLNIVADRELYEKDSAAHLERLMVASQRVDDVSRSLGPDADPMLRHYLDRQSYVKALDWLESHVS